MTKSVKLWLAADLVGLGAGCRTTQQMLGQSQPTALDTALRRGRFELGCPGAQAVLLSDDFVQPAVQGPRVTGISRLEYTYGVEGRGRRTTLVVMCQEGSGTCFAANPRGENQGRP